MESIKTLKELLAEARDQQNNKAVANFAYKLGDRYLDKGKREQALPFSTNHTTSA